MAIRDFEAEFDAIVQNYDYPPVEELENHARHEHVQSVAQARLGKLSLLSKMYLRREETARSRTFIEKEAQGKVSKTFDLLGVKPEHRQIILGLAEDIAREEMHG